VSVWHGDQNKRKSSGGRKKSFRKKRNFESGSFATETLLGKTRKKKSRRRGGNIKIRLARSNLANVSNKSTGKTMRSEILRVALNPANIDYDRRGIITKGSVIETSIGMARVTSRPGQDGILNAILITEK